MHTDEFDDVGVVELDDDWIIDETNDQSLESRKRIVKEMGKTI
jgi:hypothetical protein